VDLRDGDTIYVARAELAYVFGQVKTPGSYPIKTDTTVLQALSLAGGVLPTGAMNRTRVIRTLDGEKKELKVELTDIVQPGDTLVVPERFF
jgi:polysaccharide export outer membrane protein